MIQISVWCVSAVQKTPATLFVYNFQIYLSNVKPITHSTSKKTKIRECETNTQAFPNTVDEVQPIISGCLANIHPRRCAVRLPKSTTHATGQAICTSAGQSPQEKPSQESCNGVVVMSFKGVGMEGCWYTKMLNGAGLINLQNCVVLRVNEVLYHTWSIWDMKWVYKSMYIPIEPNYISCFWGCWPVDLPFYGSNLQKYGSFGF